LNDAMDLLRADDWNVRLRMTGQPDIDRLAGLFNDMMGHLHKQRVSILEQRHLLSLLADVSPSGIIVCGFDGEVRICNPAARRMTGSDGVPDAIKDMSDDTDVTFRRADGTVLQCSRRHFLDNGVRQSFFIIENVTEPVTSAEKEAYEKLIRLIAHEVNNTVAGLTTAMGVLEGCGGDYDAVISACRDRAFGLSEFIGRFADVVRMPDPIRSPVEFGKAVAGMRAFLESMCSQRDIALSINVPARGPVVDVDWPMMEQVLVNIVKNAAESISHPGGMINVAVCADPASVTVTDNGCGITPEKAGKIFTPFFTDKPSGQGIGLTFVREVLARHGFCYSLSTDPDDGLTRFEIRLSREM
ncbi:MAG: PAS domain-containing sensor histidine kinase, partial [Muribaculaceae bacterium]|nr:PAS domain-containing sensor histidine kinase [Muribaculaceae bacterium]